MNYRLIVCGPAGGGKSTLISHICKDYGVSSFDVRDLVIDYLKQTKKKELVGDELRVIYIELIDKLPTLDVQILEIANNWPDIFFEQIIESFFQDSIGKIIYVDVSLETSIKRVKGLEYPPPESTVRRQHSFGYEYFEKVAGQKEIPILKVNGEGNFNKEYSKVKQFLESAIS